MLTAIVMFILYGADLAFVALLIARPLVGDLFGGLLLAVAFHLTISSLLAHVLIRFFPVADGRHATDSVHWDRWRAQGVITIVSSNYFDQFVPLFLRANWYRLFGAKLESGVIIGGRLVDPFLTTMKRGSQVGADGIVLGHVMVKTELLIGRVVVQPFATIGSRAMVMPGTEIGERAAIGACSLLTSGKKVGAGEIWTGIPARPLSRSAAHPIDRSEIVG